MAGAGNPDYKKVRMMTIEELNKMKIYDILFNYIIIKTSFIFKYPSIPCFADEHSQLQGNIGTAAFHE